MEQMIGFANGYDTGSNRTIQAPRQEIWRYLGYKKQTPDAQMLEIIEEICKKLEACAKPKAFYRSYPIIRKENGTLLIANTEIVSKNLSRNLQGCEHAILLAATLGIEVDRQLQAYGRTNVSKQIILQAASAAYLEEYLDCLCTEKKQEAKENGYGLRPRFSPGYGDFSLTYQSWIAGELEIGKRLGISLSDSLMMMPSKSVTALIGIGREETECTVSGCEVCEKKDCMFRRDREA